MSMFPFILYLIDLFSISLRGHKMIFTKRQEVYYDCVFSIIYWWMHFFLPHQNREKKKRSVKSTQKQRSYFYESEALFILLTYVQYVQSGEKEKPIWDYLYSCWLFCQSVVGAEGKFKLFSGKVSPKLGQSQFLLKIPYRKLLKARSNGSFLV